MTLRRRLSVLISCLLALVLGAGLGWLQYFSVRQADRRNLELLEAAGRRIQVGVGDAIPLRQLIQEEKKLSPAPLSIALYEGDRLVELEGHEPPLAEQGWLVRSFSVHGRRVVLGFPVVQTYEALQRQAYFLAGLGALLWVSLSGTTYWVVAATLRPIQRLADQAGEAIRYSGPAQLEAPSPDGELVHLVNTLNRLLDQLHQRSARREQFHVAVSHELRTPLQALLGHLELALLRPRSTSEYVVILQECTHQTQRLTQLIEALLLLNRLDYAPVARETVDLVEALPVVPDGTRLEVGPEQLRVPGTLALVEVLLRNLLSNAERYRTPGSEIRVELSAEYLLVENVRPSQRELDVHRLREPFCRAEPGDAAGNGLGLALVSAVADRLDWRLELAAPPGRFVAQVFFR